MPTNRDLAQHYEDKNQEARAAQRQRDADSFDRAVGEKPKREPKAVRPKRPKPSSSKPKAGRGGLDG